MSGSSSLQYREYVVAALLHDVGKLIRRAKLCAGEPAKRHVEHSVEFVDFISNALCRAGLNVDLVKRLVEGHHEGDYGIAPYDRAAALERLRGDEESGGRLAIPDRGEHQIPLVLYEDEKTALYVPPCPLPQSLREAEGFKPSRDISSITPERVCQCYQQSYRELMRLAGELRQLEMSYSQLVETLVYILKATASFVPAAVYGVDKPDTSLFAHLILAAALASTGGEFFLVSIDVGRIQEYISRARTTARAMSILRGRSLRITLLQKLAARRLIEEINKALGGDVVTHANILIDTGGEVLLIVPKVEGIEKIVERIEEEVLKETEGMLTLYIHYSGPHRLDDIKDFYEIMRRHTHGVVERKVKFRLYPAPASAGNAKSKFGAYSFYNDTCDFCGRPAATRAVEEDLNLCDLCAEEYFVGKAARNLQAVLITRGLDVAGDRVGGCRLDRMDMLGYTVLFAGGACDAKALAQVGQGGSLYVVNSRDFIGRASGVAYGFIFTNQHIPQAEWAERPVALSLEELEGIAVFVKLDANAMGRRKFEASKRPSLLVTFSTSVSMAYELYSALLAGDERFRESVYVVFSGGDDAILAGDVAALSYASRLAEYAESWGFRTAIGVKVESDHYPVYYAFINTEERLEEAKEKDRKKSLAVFFDNPLLYIEAGRLREVYNAVESLVLLGGDREKLDKAARYFYTKLMEIRRAADLCEKNPLAARKTAAKALIDLAYFVNRRGGEGLEKVIELAGALVRPEQFAKVYAPVLKCEKSGLEGLVGELNRVIIALNLLHLMSKREK
ncbi:conserved hypothetical protein [Pyrobaculum aerophilum str. IM2]|uniref:Cyclic oligoadenylate synthase n=2 Tax=Pyrobaculum aerophilum TaxID=13773 RepID=Q8ZZS3_PYRAE|nr:MULTISPECIES: type III-A CRISPR-associated protein Cas10/Csm1 [Pyrobaculum]AAL62566.1 conserved hypothetical protein [Pyrobaculum aerophilum str. IM2]HII46814.1 type III-A CRISPR-associated protein Cas10/Csm1 [Pyrobaculum aerophilum]